jgi:hypothetical protein
MAREFFIKMRLQKRRITLFKGGSRQKRPPARRLTVRRRFHKTSRTSV